VTSTVDIDRRSRDVAPEAEGFGADDLGTFDGTPSEGLSLSELLGEVFLPAATRDGSDGASDRRAESA
jgi:hypothetical protein